MTILMGNGDGTFTEIAAIPAAGPVSIAVGDFNGDGKPDLAVSNPGAYEANGSVTVLLGNGDGTFSAAAVSPATGVSPNLLLWGTSMETASQILRLQIITPES